MEFSRQEYWSELPFPSLSDFPDPGIELVSPALEADSLPSEWIPGKPNNLQIFSPNFWAVLLNISKFPFIRVSLHFVSPIAVCKSTCFPTYLVIEYVAQFLYFFPILVLDMICCCLVAKSCPTLCDPMVWSPPGSSLHGVSQARILEWVDISFFRGSFRPRDRTQVSCLADGFFTTEPPGKPDSRNILL